MPASQPDNLAPSVPRVSNFPISNRASAGDWSLQLQRASKVCKVCRVGKRKCDKRRPACGRCDRLRLNCSYDDPDNVQNATIKGISTTPEDSGNSSPVALALPMELDPPASYPIQARWYMPFLLQQFLVDFGMSKIAVNPNSIAYQMQTVYVRESLSDPCMFHACLYAASAHLDAARNDCDNPITTYHQTQTLHLVRQRIAQSQHGIDEGLDGAIASVIPLAFFTYLSGNKTESQSHLDGMVQMMTSGGWRRSQGLSVLLDGLITLSALVFTIVFDHPYHELSSLAWTEWPLRPPIQYISKLISQVLRAYDEERVPQLAHDVVHDIYDVMRSFNTTSPNRHYRAYISSIYDRWHSERDRFKSEVDSTEFPAFLTQSKERQGPVHCAVYLTGILFFTVFGDSDLRPDTKFVRGKLLEKLRMVLQDTEDSVWLEANTFLFSWICLTCAAVCDGVQERAWFYYRQGPIFMALVNGPSCVQGVLSYYTWLRNRLTQM